MVWGITGAGGYLAGSLSIMKKINRDSDVEITVLLSKSAEMVVKWYKLWADLKSSFTRVKIEKNANVPFMAGPLQIGRYDLFFVSPATANTVAKIAYGIADTLITNCVAQTTKSTTPVYIYPTDQELSSGETYDPYGNKVTISTRQLDVENVKRIDTIEGLTVLKHPAEIEAIVAAIEK